MEIWRLNYNILHVFVSKLVVINIKCKCEKYLKICAALNEQFLLLKKFNYYVFM